MSDQPTTRIIGPTAPPGLQDILNSQSAAISANINCAKIGKISSYNAVLNTAEVSVQAKVELTDGRTFSYPLLVDCPVFKLTGGSAFLSMPILPGDTCIVLFNDTDIDNWFYTGQAVLPATNRKHSLSDGLVLVGVSNILNGVPALPGIAEMYAGANLLALGNAVISLKKILDDLIDTLKTATTDVVGTPYPFTVATIAALTAVKVEVALLLDKGSSPA